MVRRHLHSKLLPSCGFSFHGSIAIVADGSGRVIQCPRQMPIKLTYHTLAK